MRHRLKRRAKNLGLSERRATSLNRAASAVFCARRTPLVLVAAVLITGFPAVGAAEDGPPDPGDAAPDTVEVLTETSHADQVTLTIHQPPPPGSIIDVRADELAARLADLPGVRFVGSVWKGQHASVARGALPASLTSAGAPGDPWGDWLSGGVDILGTSSPAAGVVHAPSGPNLSTWPAYVLEAVSVTPGRIAAPFVVRAGEALPAGERVPELAGGVSHLLSSGSAVRTTRTSALALTVLPGRPPSERPFSRVTMGTGAHGWKALGFEFGRRVNEDRVGIEAYAESRSGRAPDPGGSFDAEFVGGRVSIALPEEWSAQLSGIRRTHETSVPFAGATIATTTRSTISSDLTVRVTDGRSHVEIFHDDSWIEDGRSGDDGGAASATRDGARAAFASDSGWLDEIALGVEWREADGSILSDQDGALGAFGSIGRTIAIGTGSISVHAGVDVLDGEALPSADVLYARAGPSLNWWLGAALGGRHPTILERRQIQVTVPSAENEPLAVRGNEALDPEQFLLVEAACTFKLGDVEVAARGEAVRVFSPVALSAPDSGITFPRNRGDETASSFSLLVSPAGRSGPGWTAGLDLWLLDPDGALNALSPVPTATARASAWLPASFFDSYLRVRFEVSVRQEMGLERGPWEAIVDDAATSLDAVAVAAVGAARLFLSVENALEARESADPWLRTRERVVSAGFSWSFWD